MSKWKQRRQDHTYWYPKGDINDAEAPSITQYDIRMRSAPVSSAAVIAIGNTNAAAALFVTMLLIKKVARYTAPYNPPSTILKIKRQCQGSDINIPLLSIIANTYIRYQRMTQS
jgi:hypothetical protein